MASEMCLERIHAPLGLTQTGNLGLVIYQPVWPTERECERARLCIAVSLRTTVEHIARPLALRKAPITRMRRRNRVECGLNCFDFATGVAYSPRAAG
jgi:hypothetical protein